MRFVGGYFPSKEGTQAIEVKDGRLLYVRTAATAKESLGMTFYLLPLVFLLSVLLLLPLFFGLMHMAFRAPRVVEQGRPDQLGMKYREVAIPTKEGHKLFGWVLGAPCEPNGPFLVMLHGWGANAEFMLPLAEPFYRAGINVLLIDA